MPNSPEPTSPEPVWTDLGPGRAYIAPTGTPPADWRQLVGEIEQDITDREAARLDEERNRLPGRIRADRILAVIGAVACLLALAGAVYLSVDGINTPGRSALAAIRDGVLAFLMFSGSFFWLGITIECRQGIRRNRARLAQLTEEQK